jgi:hypothetical protein
MKPALTNVQQINSQTSTEFSQEGLTSGDRIYQRGGHNFNAQHGMLYLFNVYSGMQYPAC